MTRLRSNGWRALGIGAAVLLAAAGGLAIGAATAAAAPAQTRYVATTGDNTENDCTDAQQPCRTIEYAVDQANAGDTVSIAAGTYPESVFVRISLTFVGASRTSVILTGSDGDPGFDISGVDTQSPVAVTLRSLSVKHVADAPGVVAQNADVTISGSDVGDDDISGVIVLDGSLTTRNSTFDGNHGNPIQNELGGFGIVGAGASASVVRSTASDNDFGGIYLIGAQVEADSVAPNQPAAPSLTVLRSTVADNGAVGVAAFHQATAIDTSTVADNHGAGVYTSQDTVTVANSTVSGTQQNDAAQGVLISQAGLVEVQPVLATRAIRKLSGGTATDIARAAAHQSSRPMSVQRAVLAPDAPATAYDVSGSIVAKNSTLPDCDATVSDGGYNLSSDADNSCGFAAAKHDRIKADPKLGSLADNGGPTQTLLPAKGSDAIDAIPTGSAGCSSGVTDQRGVSHPQGAKCDIGAVEVAQPPLVISPASLPHGTVGEEYHVTFSATGGLGPPYAFSLVAGDLPPGLSFGDGGDISGTPTNAGSYKITVSVDDPVQKHYVIVIEAAAGASTSPTPSNGTEPVANTGANVLPLTTFGVTAVLAGLVLLYGAVLLGRRAGRHH